eukprot:GHUV01015715.1.p1 GENE.GHUV01015715.1~~GHUV01015715.1.p1  ORF type:complete len:198 (+),score=63.02 GHUV01015715.1:821-1414(+)
MCIPYAQASNLQLHHGDVMQLDLQQLVQQAATATAAAGQQTPQQHPDALHSSSTSRTSSSGAGQSPSKRKVKVVANLPYNITKDFLLSLLPQGDVVSELSIMIQEEVAQRLVDPTPSRPDYRAMSVITHYYSKPVYRFRWAHCTAPEARYVYVACPKAGAIPPTVADLLLLQSGGWFGAMAWLVGPFLSCRSGNIRL